MASKGINVRVEVNKVLRVWREGMRMEAISDASALARANPCALSCNLLADFRLEYSLDVIASDSDPRGAHDSLVIAVDNYERAVTYAPKCIQTAAAHGVALVALGRLNDAREEFDRGLRIECPDHPWINHPIIQNRAGCSKDDYVADARGRIIAQRSMLDEEENCHKTRKMIKRLGIYKDHASEILAAVRQLTRENPHSVRAKILQYQQSEKILHLRCNPSISWDTMQVGLEAIQDAASEHPNSLPIAYYHAKHLTALGCFTAAKDECHRALSIVKPDEPTLHDFVLGSTPGYLFDDRVSGWKDDLKLLLVRIVSIARKTVLEMSEEEKKHFLSLKVKDLIEYLAYDSDASPVVHEAVGSYRPHTSWSFWFCPIAVGGSHCEFRTRKASYLLEHITCHVDLDYRVCHALSCVIPQQTMLQLEAHDDYVSLMHDENGLPILCFDSVEKFVECFSTEDDKCSFKEFISRKSVSANAKFYEFLDLAERNGSPDPDAIKRSWLEFLKEANAGYVQYILPLIVTMRWEEIKQMIHSRERPEKMDKQFQEQHHVVVNEDILRCDKPAKQPAPSSGKFRPHSCKAKLVKEVREPASFTLWDKILAEDAEYSPYGDDGHHLDYDNALKEVHPGNALCTACFFEKKSKRSFSYIVHHLVQEHGTAGIKCVICGLRFITEEALSFHKDLRHNKQKNLVAPG